MRAIAEYAMVGRRQAIIVVLLSGMIPPFYLISAAVVALVCLRRETNEALLILLWALLPAGVHLFMRGDPTPLLLMPGAALLALVLKRTESWQKVLIAATLLGIFAQVCLPLFSNYIASVDELAERFVTVMSTGDAGTPFTADDFAIELKGFFGASVSLFTVLCLMLSRWWQAIAVNPGGFQQEFHSLKLDAPLAGFFLAALLAGMAGVVPLNGWTNIAGIAPTFVGLGVAHGLIALRKMGGHWLTGVYLAALFFVPAIILLALTDSVADYRQRLRLMLNQRTKTNTNKGSSDEDSED
jgi:hypothetical protein